MTDNHSYNVDADALAAMVGQDATLSEWFLLDQDRINRFADVTEDRFFIHTDPPRAAAETPWGGTIAHGFLTLSMLSAMVYQAVPGVDGAQSSVNYGFDRVRFVSPVPTGSRVRGRFVLSACDRSKPGQISVTYDVAVEIEGRDIAAGHRPAIAATWLCRYFMGPA